MGTAAIVHAGQQQPFTAPAIQSPNRYA